MNTGDFAWLAAPATALLAACALLVPLGGQVLARGVVFIDLAVAQVTACGVLLAGLLLHGAGAMTTAAASAGAALLGAALVGWLARRAPQGREALIGLVYIAAASASVLVVAADPHGRERLAALLAADVLWAPWRSVLWLTASALLLALLLAWRPRLLARDAFFYPAFALALSVAVPALGLYLVFALLIAPALWTLRGSSQRVATLAAAAASSGGLLLSWALDWPSGACVALALSALGLASVAGRGLRRAPAWPAGANPGASAGTPGRRG